MKKARQVSHTDSSDASNHHQTRIDNLRIENRMMQIIRDFLPGHKNIVNYLGYVQSEKQISIVMELMPNHSLGCHIESNQFHFDWKSRLSMMRGITDGIKALHDCDIVHHDLKPDNVLLDQDLNPKLCDFGLSKYVDDEMEIRGTPTVMPLELLTGSSPYTLACDIYSLGMLFYSIVTGKFAFAEEAIDSFLALLTYLQAGKQLSIPTDCPNNIADIIKKTWSSDPTQRPRAIDILNSIKEEEMNSPFSQPLHQAITLGFTERCKTTTLIDLKPTEEIKAKLG